MSRLPWCVLVLSLSARSESFALITTNNRSLSSQREDLHYADDDGVHYAELFAERFGAGHTMLLTQLDAQTSALNPGFGQVPAPTRKNLDEAGATLRQSLEAAHARGAHTEVYLVFAGHGDVDQGVGYIELADARFTARDLEALIERLPADRTHLIIDSCNSYFLLNPRKPGGRRWAAAPVATGSLTSRHPHVGTLISTNADAVSYEWSELQSGIFSYEVRSGLRGAADANGDHLVSYQELVAFIEKANQRVKNEAYRPRVAFSPPDGNPSTPVLALASTGPHLDVDGAREHRLTVRTALGVRLLDVHQEAGTDLRLNLPVGGGSLTVSERTSGDDGRPETKARVIPDGYQGPFEALEEAPLAASRGGDAPVFSLLFAEPFGRQALADFAAHPPEKEEPIYGVSRSDVARLEWHLRMLAQTQRTEQTIQLAASLFQSSALDLATTAALVAVTQVAPNDGDRLAERAHLIDDASEAARSKKFAEAEHSFEHMAVKASSERRAGGIVAIIVGAALTVAPPSFCAMNKLQMTPLAYALMAAGVGLAGVGTLIHAVYRSALERAWEQYLADPSVAEARGRSGQATLTPDVPAGVFMLGFSGTF